MLQSRSGQVAWLGLESKSHTRSSYWKGQHEDRRFLEGSCLVTDRGHSVAAGSSDGSGTGATGTYER